MHMRGKWRQSWPEGGRGDQRSALPERLESDGKKTLSLHERWRHERRKMSFTFLFHAIHVFPKTCGWMDAELKINVNFILHVVAVPHSQERQLARCYDHWKWTCWQTWNKKMFTSSPDTFGDKSFASSLARIGAWKKFCKHCNPNTGTKRRIFVHRYGVSTVQTTHKLW